MLEVEIGLSETMPQTPRPIYILKILLERYSEHPTGYPYMPPQRNTEPVMVPFLLRKGVDSSRRFRDAIAIPKDGVLKSRGFFFF